VHERFAVKFLPVFLASVILVPVAWSEAIRIPAAAALCDSCHGLGGAGLVSMNAPRLAGLQAWYLERQLRDFKEGARGGNPDDVYGAQMRVMAGTLETDAAIHEAAEFFASLQPGQSARTLMDGAVDRGAALYSACAACHGASAEGMDATRAPRLRGADDWYLLRQLRNFRAGIRGSDPRNPSAQGMRAIAVSLPDEQALRDLAVYLASLR
jgi:cytochrome c oxidase subunit 2